MGSEGGFERRRGYLLAGLVGLVAAFPSGAGAAPPPAGALTQLAGLGGCFTVDGTSDAGPNTCGVGQGLAETTTTTVSPDGKYVYADGFTDGGDEGGITVFSRSAVTGALTQLGGTDGCLNPDGSSRAGANTCTVVRALYDAGDGRDLAITSDGKWAYMAVDGGGGPYGGAVLVFSRAPSTGVLSQVAGTAGCLDGTGGSQVGSNTCQLDTYLDSPSAVSLSPDQKFLYVTDYGDQGILVYSRNTSTGVLTRVQCVRQYTGPGLVPCTVGRALGGSQSVVISADGKHAYAGHNPTGISIFDRNLATGKLSQKAGVAGCITDDGLDDTQANTCTAGRDIKGASGLSLSPNGQTLYVPAEQDKGLAIFHVNGDGTLTQLPGTAGCVTESGKDQNGNPCLRGRALSAPYGSVVSPDGKSLYVMSDAGTSAGVAIFSLNPSTGRATQLAGKPGCVTADGADAGTSGVCAVGRAVDDAWEGAISPDGRSFYVAGLGAEGMAIFRRETAPACTGAKASTPHATPVTIHLKCSDADGQKITLAIAKRPAHGKLGPINQVAHTVRYTPAAGFSGEDGFTFTASDGTNVSAPARVSVTVH
jgi:DNA-binding beta-propeller fold protein YncE